MADQDDYRPIDCHRYSQLEVAILRRWRLRLCWQDEHGDAHVEVVEPFDLRTANHEEFLLARRDNGETLRVRLDRLRNVEPVGEAVDLWD